MTRSCPRTTWSPASRCGGIAIPPGSGSRWRHRSARDADAQQRARIHLRRDRNPECARRRYRRCCVVAQCGVRHGVNVPDWGFSSSPLVVDDVVIVATSGQLIAYELAPGQQRWIARTKGGSYSSPHLAMIDGVDRSSTCSADPA